MTQKPIITAALTAPSETLPTEAPPVQAAMASAPVNSQGGDVTQAVGSVEILDECYVVRTTSTDICGRFTSARPRKTPSSSRTREK